MTEEPVEGKVNDTLLIEDETEVLSVMSPEALQELSDEELQDVMIDLEYLGTEIIKPFYENQKNTILELIRRKGLDYYFQDDESGAVLKTAPLDGKYVFFFPYQIVRTRFSDSEPKQSLSNKEAEEKGFILKLGDRRKKKS